MKILRWTVCGLFLVTLCLFGLFSWQEKQNRDDTFPVLSLPSGDLELSIHDPEQKLLDGVTAFDEKDGDITGRILLESISKFTESGVCRITYAVSDADCHVTKASRTLRYTDYTPPVFSLDMPLVFTADDKTNIREQVHASDCLDGDISDRVTVLGTDYNPSSPGVYTLSMQVTNSRGDRVYLDLPVHVDETGHYDAVLTLTEPLIYVKQGTQPDFPAYISDVSDGRQSVTDYQLKTSTRFDSHVPGVYSVHYYVSLPDGAQGHTVLTVIVEE